MGAEHECCRVCGSKSVFAFKLPVLRREVAYFDCPTCGHFQTEAPYWMQEAYGSAINDLDTGVMMRNLANARLTIMTLASFGLLKGRVVDHAGGYGILVRMLRDAGIEALWRDKYCENLLARGFEAGPEQGADLITAFEVLEHLERPVQELERLLEEAPVVLLSTELIPGPSLPPKDWWYLGVEHGQHVGLFRRQTLAWIAQTLGCAYASHGNSFHLFSRVRIPSHWRLMQTLHRTAPLISRFALSSRTMSDHDQLRMARIERTDRR